MALSVGELTGQLDLDNDKFKRKVDSSKKDLDSLRYHMGNTTVRITDKFSRDMLIISNSFSTLSRAAITFSMTTAKAFLAIPVLTHVIASANAMLGVLGLIPAIAGAAYLAVKTLKVGFDGFGEAMKNIRDVEAFNEAIKDMPPPMQDTARAVRGLLPQWDALKKNVQTTLFNRVADDVSALGNRYLPILDSAMTKTADGFNQASHSVTRFLKNDKTVKDMSGTFDRMAGFTNSFAASLRPITQMLVDISTVGSEFLPGMGQAWLNGANGAAAFIREARETGKLKQWIRDGIDALKAFVGILKNIGGMFKAIFTAAGIEGEKTLQMVERITAQWVAWMKSAEGQEKIKALFEGITNVAMALAEVLPHLGDAIVTILNAFSALPAPVQSVIGSFIGWLAVIGFVVGKGLALGMALKMLIPALGRVAKAIVMQVIPAMLRMVVTCTVAIAKITWMAAVWVAKTTWMVMTSIAKITLMVVIWTAQLALLAVVAIGYMVRIAVTAVAQFTWMAATAIAKVVWMVLTVLAEFAMMVAVATGHMIAMAAKTVAQWAIMSAGALLHAARMAAAWFIAMGPVGWVIAAIIALVALIIYNWDTIKRVTKEAFDAVWNWIKQAWARITAEIRREVEQIKGIINWFRGLPAMIGGWIGQAREWAIREFLNLVMWMHGLGGRITAAIGNLGDLLVGVGRDIVNGLWRGIQAGWSWLTGQVSSLAGQLYKAAQAALGIGSPSKVFRDKIGQWIPKGMAVGIDSHADQVRRSVDALVANLPTIDMSKFVRPAEMELAGVGSRGRGGGVHIEHFHTGGPTNERRLAEEIDWLGRGKGV